MKLPEISLSLFTALAASLVCAGSAEEAPQKPVNPADPRAKRAPSRPAPRVHDPSTIVRSKDEYWVFATGTGVRSLRSKDLVSWTPGPPVLSAVPRWVDEFLPRHRGHFWAPDAIHLKGRYLLYYSVSQWGKNTSAIALASSPTLDPSDPGFRWKDEGVVIRSSKSDDFNAIDPSVLLDSGGRLWLAFGSFWTGIKLVELDPATGNRLAPDSEIHALASHREIEAPCLAEHDGLFYLFVNWGLCCRGVRSTYRILVGRSQQVTGPYLDRDGRDLREGGGSLFLDTEDDLIGPGHPAVLREGEQTRLSYHFYDRTRAGAPTLAVRRLEWDAEGWPVAGAFVSPPGRASVSAPAPAPVEKPESPAKP